MRNSVILSRPVASVLFSIWMGNIREILVIDRNISCTHVSSAKRDAALSSYEMSNGHVTGSKPT